MPFAHFFETRFTCHHFGPDFRPTSHAGIRQRRMGWSNAVRCPQLKKADYVLWVPIVRKLRISDRHLHEAVRRALRDLAPVRVSASWLRGDLNLRNQAIDFLGPHSGLKTKNPAID